MNLVAVALVAVCACGLVVFPAAAQAPSPAVADTAVHEQLPVQVFAPRPKTTVGGASAIEANLDSSCVQPAPTLEQVLREMPLVVVRTNSRGEAQPALRGGEDRQIAVLVDGVPMTLSWDHRTDLSAVPLTAARGVTLHRGLASLLMGPNALGGAVEVDIARGRSADTAPAPWVVDLGVDHTGARALGLTSGLLRVDDHGHWLLRAGGGYRGSDGFVLAHGLDQADAATRARLTSDGRRRLNTDLQSIDGFLSLRRVGRGGAWASFTGLGSRLERGIAPEAHTTEPRLWRYPYQARGLGALAAGTGMHDTPWGRGDLEASLGVALSRTEIEEFDGFDYGTVVGGEKDDDRTLTARLLGDHTLGERGDLRFATTFANVSHDEVVNDAAPAGYRQRLWSIASETDWRVGGEAVPIRVTLGGALDGADTPESADKPRLAALRDWGARVGATAVLARGRVIVHGAASRRARFPALRELYSGALGRFLENPALRAETERVGELGTTFRRSDGEIQVVAFHQVLADAITRVAVATPEGNRFQRVNQGQITASGVETVGRLDLGGLALGGDATIQRTRGIDSGGNAFNPEYEPAVHGGVWGESPLPSGLRGRLEARGTSRQRYVDLDSGESWTLAPTVRLDASVARSFALSGAGPFRRLDAVLALENLADRTLFDQAGLPEPGRTVRLQVRFW